jgi:hypothetical protein
MQLSLIIISIKSTSRSITRPVAHKKRLNIKIVSLIPDLYRGVQDWVFLASCSSRLEIIDFAESYLTQYAVMKYECVRSIDFTYSRYLTKAHLMATFKKTSSK